jgi:hypothetical protein
LKAKAKAKANKDALSRSLSPALVAQYTMQLQPIKLLRQAKLVDLFATELQESGVGVLCGGR